MGLSTKASTTVVQSHPKPWYWVPFIIRFCPSSTAGAKFIDLHPTGLQRSLTHGKVKEIETLVGNLVSRIRDTELFVVFCRYIYHLMLLSYYFVILDPIIQ